jgi:hypothetical protein
MNFKFFVKKMIIYKKKKKLKERDRERKGWQT